MPMHKSFPFNFNRYGHIEDADASKHIRDMMEQILFTVPGERVNRPDFGCGVQRMVFGTTRPEMMSVKQAEIQSELHRYLGHLISLQEVRVTTQESRIEILIRYMLYENQNHYEALFTQ
jgi:phage baseplate assembly protein W